MDGLFNKLKYYFLVSPIFRIISLNKMKQKSSLLSWRWFHILPVIVSFACMAGWGWLAKQSEVLNIKGSQPSLVDSNLLIISNALQSISRLLSTNSFARRQKSFYYGQLCLVHSKKEIMMFWKPITIITLMLKSQYMQVILNYSCLSDLPCPDIVFQLSTSLTILSTIYRITARARNGLKN